MDTQTVYGPLDPWPSVKCPVCGQENEPNFKDRAGNYRHASHRLLYHYEPGIGIVVDAVHDLAARTVDVVAELIRADEARPAEKPVTTSSWSGVRYACKKCNTTLSDPSPAEIVKHKKTCGTEIRRRGKFDLKAFKPVIFWEEVYRRMKPRPYYSGRKVVTDDDGFVRYAGEDPEVAA